MSKHYEFYLACCGVWESSRIYHYPLQQKTDFKTFTLDVFPLSDNCICIEKSDIKNPLDNSHVRLYFYDSHIVREKEGSKGFFTIQKCNQAVLYTIMNYGKVLYKDKQKLINCDTKIRTTIGTENTKIVMVGSYIEKRIKEYDKDYKRKVHSI